MYLFVWFDSEPEKKRLMPAELRVDTLSSDLGDKQHPSVAMRSIILEMMDNAIQLSHKAKYTNEQKDDFMLWDRANNYKPLEQPVRSNVKVKFSTTKNWLYEQIIRTKNHPLVQG